MLPRAAIVCLLLAACDDRAAPGPVAPAADAAIVPSSPPADAAPPSLPDAALVTLDAPTPAPEWPYQKGALPADTLPPGTPHGDQIPVDTIVVLMQENRSFDHYLGQLRNYQLRRYGASDVEGQ